MSNGPDAVKVECGFCGTPYAWEQNVLDGNYLWVRRCKAACRRGLHIFIDAELREAADTVRTLLRPVLERAQRIEEAARRLLPTWFMDERSCDYCGEWDPAQGEVHPPDCPPNVLRTALEGDQS